MRTAHVGMLGTGPLGVQGMDAVAVVAQNLAHVAVLAGTERQSELTGGFQARRAVALGQPKKPQAGAVAVLGALVAREQPSDELTGGEPDATPTLDQTLRGPLDVCSMRRRHVLSDGAELTATVRAHVACDPIAAGEQLHRPSGDARVDRLADERVWGRGLSGTMSCGTPP